MSDQYVYPFSAGSREQVDLLGGKGANLAEMTQLGLPVPPGFTITTDACRYYMRYGHEPSVLADQVKRELASVEKELGRTFGDPKNPLLVSVRSGAKVSMPGMMETVLNVGLNDETLEGLAELSHSRRFALDSYRRLLQMFGRTVLDIDAELFEAVLDDAKSAAGAASDVELSEGDLERVVASFKEIIEQESGSPFPQDPFTQLTMSIHAVFDSWNSPRAIVYRNTERIPHDLGTAVNVCSMVFGNLDDQSATGVAFTRDPATGARGVYGDFLLNAQGEDVVAGIRNTLSLPDMENLLPENYRELVGIMEKLERHYRDLCDIEFTIESGKLWMLQTRVGKRTAAAAFRIATALLDEGAITENEALMRVTGDQLSRLMFPAFDPHAERVLLARGMNASPGAATGHVAFTTADVLARAKEGTRSILVRRETNPDDLAGMITAEGVLTARGGKTSHAAVVARGLGRTCVCGVEAFTVDEAAREVRVDDEVVLRDGDLVSIDGTSGEVFLGEVPVRPSAVAAYFESGASLDDGDATSLEGLDKAEAELVTSVDRLMRIADRERALLVRANADTPEDAARARRMGAQGIGLTRTEHMFLGDRRTLVENLILAASPEEREGALAALLPLQRGDFLEMIREMDGLPMTVRLLDPPLHEFLPDLTELSVRIAKAEERGEHNDHEIKVLEAVKRLHEQNPMLGLRGVRLGLSIPGLFGMQTRAILEAEAQARAEGLNPQVEIMIPLVSSVRELREIKKEIFAVRDAVTQETGLKLTTVIGSMIELPRAALRADEIAEEAEFFSFGTNDLTQTTWGFSRDDVEAGFFFTYKEHGILLTSPFESIDQFGVGELVRIGTERGRAVNPDLHVGVCGEHGGDPSSIHFFNWLGLDYVSCSPFRVPVARLEAGRATLSVDDFEMSH